MLRVLVLSCAFAAFAGPGVASAATFAVTKTQDTLDGSCAADDCSLREALTAANAGVDADIVTVPAGTYPLTGGALDISASVTLTGAGARTTILQGNGTARVIDAGGATRRSRSQA